ncbi:MAG: hypothetical protein V4606_01990 [Patescibacteria group bacterium]
MATFGPKQRDIASEFEEGYNNPNLRFRNSSENDSGIQNSRIENGNQPRTLTSRPSEDGRRKRTTARRYQGRNESLKETEISPRNERVDQRYYREEQQIMASNDTALDANKPKITILARARGVSFGGIVASIAFTLWPIQILLASIGGILLGMSTQVEESWLAWAADKVVQNVGWVVGFEYSDLSALASAAFALLAIIGGVLLLGALLGAKIMRLHPLFGNATTLKTGLFLCAIISCFLPIVPMTAIWAWAVAAYPK